MANLIGMNANQVPTNGMLGTLAFQDTLSYPVSNVTTATTATTLTRTATLLKITPASYGVAVTLPDATTCSVGGPLHIIDNKGAYPVRVLNSSGTLLGFIFAGVVSHVSLSDNSTAAGVWTVENSELVGPSAQLLTTNLNYLGGRNPSVIAIDSSREFIMGYNAANTIIYGVVYNKSTNTFGTVTAIRTVSVNDNKSACLLSATDQILVVSCHTTAFEAVTLSISGTTITVNTAATATLSANISAFADGCGLIAVGSSFVTSYTVDTPAAQIRALSISGTTVTIGSATVLDGTAGGLIASASTTGVIAVSSGTSAYFKYYGVSGSTITPGTGATYGSATTTIVKLFPLGTRWGVLFMDGTSSIASVLSLSGTTVTRSGDVIPWGGGGSYADAIVVGSNKALLLSTRTTNNANILTDTAGTASAGTAITLDGGTFKAALYVSGTDVYVGSLATNVFVHKIDCSGVSAVLTSSQNVGTNTPNAQSFITTSNSVLSRTPENTYGTSFAQSLIVSAAAQVQLPRVQNGILSAVSRNKYSYAGANTSVSDTAYRGKSDSERWVTDATTVITKIECAA